MNTKPMVSIIIPSYNSEKYIKETLDSVCNQTYKNYEVVVVDDASTDNSLKIVMSYKNKMPGLKIISLKSNGGVSNARNVGIKESKGEYIALLDSDDCWKRDKLKFQMNFMLGNNIDFSFTAYEIMSDKKRKIIHAIKSLTYKRLLNGNPIACFTVVGKKELFNKYHFENIKHEDYALWLKVSKEYKLYGLDINLGTYRRHKNSISSNKMKSASWVWNIYRNVEKINFFKCCYHFFVYTLHGIIKYF